MRKVVLVLLLIFAAQRSQAAWYNYARISNMTLDLWLTGGDFEGGPYPHWWTVAPFGWSYSTTPTPVPGAAPYVTYGEGNWKFWASFDNAVAPGSLRSGGVIGIHELSGFRSSFDYDIRALTPSLQLQVWITSYVNRMPNRILVWHSTNTWQSGHVSIERYVSTGVFWEWEVALAPPVVPEPASLLTLGFGLSGLGAFLLSRRRR